jgi:molybdopterin molybdotransferase
MCAAMSDTLINATVEDARARMLRAFIKRAAVENVALYAACGRVLMQDVAAKRDQPPFAASAMDGYALRSADAPGDFTLAGESAAGAGFARTLQNGECVRIFTGAPLPDGADCIAIQEDVARNGAHITIPATPKGQHIRDAGIDFRAGDILFRNGARIDAIAVSLIAATGTARIDVARRARVTLMSGGDEIVAAGATPGPFQIFDSITPGLCALSQQWGAEVRALAPQADDQERLTRALTDAMNESDLVVTIGGASVGDRDLMKPALRSLGAALHVDKIAVRPGKPTWFATTPGCAVLGLPGNPASALVCAHLFLRPLLAQFLGDVEETPRFVRAVLALDLPANGPREHYLRAFARHDADGRLHVTPYEVQDSSLLSVFASANALTRLPARAPALRKGEMVDVVLLNR